MIRAVIDTNVFVSSFFGGKTREIIDLWKTGKVTLCLSRVILEEYFDVLRQLGLEGTIEIEELLKLFARSHHLLFTADTKKLDVVKKDPEGNKFIECTISLDTKFIVSVDKALLGIKNYMGIQIVTPSEFLKIHI